MVSIGFNSSGGGIKSRSLVLEVLIVDFPEPPLTPRQLLSVNLH